VCYVGAPLKFEWAALTTRIKNDIFTVSHMHPVFLPPPSVGTSRELAVGPVAVTSLIIYASLQSLMPCATSITNPNTAINDPSLQVE